MTSFDTASTMQTFLEEYNSKISNNSLASATSKSVQNASLRVGLRQQKPPRNLVSITHAALDKTQFYDVPKKAQF